jgi:WYL domain
VRPAGFNATEYMAATFGTIRGDGDYKVVLRFTPAYAGRIAEKQWHSSQVVKPQPDGSLILRLHVNDLREIERCEKWCQSGEKWCQFILNTENRTDTIFFTEAK